MVESSSFIPLLYLLSHRLHSPVSVMSSRPITGESRLHLPHPNVCEANLPALRMTTITSAKAGKKSVMKIAKVWRPEVGSAGISRTLATGAMTGHDDESSSIRVHQTRTVSSR